jgi:hypothetical protein
MVFTVAIDQNDGSPFQKLPVQFQVSGEIYSLSQMALMLVLGSSLLSLSKHMYEQTLW